MKKYIAFIQSVSGKEWEVGEIISNEINHNPDYCDCNSEVFYVKTYKEFDELLMSIGERIKDVSIIIQIVAHSNTEGIAFKDINNQTIEEINDYVKWSALNDILIRLYKAYGTNVTIIFLSCYSSALIKFIESPHIPIIAAEDEIVSRRAEEQLIKFFDKVCTGSDVKEAYDYMIKLFPIQDEQDRVKEDRSILKLYM